MRLSAILFKAVCIVMFWSNMASGYILEASVWRRWNAAHQNYAYVVVCHDIHNYSETLNKAQIDALATLISSCKSLSLVIENQPVSAQEYKVRGLLNSGAELQDLCVQGGHPVIEADYRLKRGRAYYKCLHALSFTSQDQFDTLNAQLRDLNCTTKTLAHEFEDALADTKESLANVGDQGALAAYGTEVLLNALVTIRNQWQHELAAWESSEGTLLDYCQQHNCLTAEYLFKAFVFDVNLLDIRMFVQALKSSATMTIVYAGGAHCATLQRYFSAYSPFMRIASQGVPVDWTREGVQIPAGLTSAEATRFTMTAERLSTAQGKELTPLDPAFLVRLVNPESFVQELPWWKRMVCRYW